MSGPCLRPRFPIPTRTPTSRPPVRNVRITFTGDSRYVICTTYPLKADTDKAKREKKKPEEMPKGGLVIVDLATFGLDAHRFGQERPGPGEGGGLDRLPQGIEGSGSARPARRHSQGVRHGTWWCAT